MADVRPIIPADVVYTRTAIALHWLTLLLIATGFSLGRWMVELPIAPQTLRVYAYHKWIGITVFLLTLARLAWRRAHPVPPPPGLPAWQRRAAAASHASLYVLMLVIPLSASLGALLYAGLFRFIVRHGEETRIKNSLLVGFGLALTFQAAA